MPESSLMGNVTSDENVETEAAPQEMVEGVQEAPEAQEQPLTQEEAGWFWADGVPGEGEPPEWYYKDKYGSVADQAKAHKDLRSKLAGFTGAPEEGYELHIDTKDSGLEISEDDPMLEQFTDFAKSVNMSQETFDGLLQLYVDSSLDAYHESIGSEKEFYKAQVEELGETYEEDKKVLDNWAKNNLSPDTYKVFIDSVTDAGKFKMFKEIREKMKATTISARGDDHSLDKHKLQQLIGDPRYLTDKSFQEYVDSLYAEAYS